MTEEKLLTQTTETRSTKTIAVESPRPSMYASVLAIAGFIILIIIVFWGLFHIASLVSPFFSSLFNNGRSTIQVTAPLTVTSGESFTLRWKYSTRESGTYALVYQCKNNFHLETPSESEAHSVPCGSAFAVPSTDNALIVTPILSGVASTSVPLSVIFMPNATSSKQAQGSVTITVLPSTIPVVEPVAVTPIPTPHTSSPADLSVRIVGVRVDQSGMAVAEFDITNQGGKPSGSYYFQAFLPTQSVYTYTSPLQSSLRAGDHIVNTIRFTQAVSGTVSIVVDHTNAVSESNESNNYASQSLGTSYNYNFNPQQYYPQPYQSPYVY